MIEIIDFFNKENDEFIIDLTTKDKINHGDHEDVKTQLVQHDQHELKTQLQLITMKNHSVPVT